MINILVFPYGSEIALEVAQSLLYDRHFHLIGCGSIKDHGRFVFNDQIDDLPWENDSLFLPAIKKIIRERRIDMVYPAMDSSILRLKAAENFLECRVVGSDLQTIRICSSKLETYKCLSDVVRTPKVYASDEKPEYPVFGKPAIGYGSRGVRKINSDQEYKIYCDSTKNAIICEFLPGEEYTIDCFSDRHGCLLFCGPRIRARTMNGISVYTYTLPCSSEFHEAAKAINSKLSPRGAWFFQMKRNKDNELTLLEVAARFGGSSALYRARGVNFAQLTLWDALDYDVSVSTDNFFVEMDRALDNKFIIDIHYNEVFMDFDDTVLLEGKYYNPVIMHFIFQCRNRQIPITLISKHKGDLDTLLQKLGIQFIFYRILHLDEKDDKTKFIDNTDAIYIDDSFAERVRIRDRCHIPVFGLDMVAALIKDDLL